MGYNSPHMRQRVPRQLAPEPLKINEGSAEVLRVMKYSFAHFVGVLLRTLYVIQRGPMLMQLLLILRQLIL